MAATTFEELKLTVSLTDQASEGLQALSVKMKSLGAALGSEQERLTSQIQAFKEKLEPFNKAQKDFGEEAGQSAGQARMLAIGVGAGVTGFLGLTGLAVTGAAALRTYTQGLAEMQQLSRELGVAPEQLTALMSAFKIQGISGSEATNILRGVQRSMVQVLDNMSPLITNLREHSKHSVAAAKSIEQYIARLREHSASGDVIGFWNEQTKAMQSMPEVLEAAGFTKQQSAEFTNSFLAAQNLGPNVRRKWEEVKPLSEQAIAASKIVRQNALVFNNAWNRIGVARGRFFDALLALPFGPDSVVVKTAVWLAEFWEARADAAEAISMQSRIIPGQVDQMLPAPKGFWQSVNPFNQRNIEREQETNRRLQGEMAKPHHGLRVPDQGTPQRFSGGGDPTGGLQTMENIQNTLRINPQNWDKMIKDPTLQAMGRKRIIDLRGQAMPLPPKASGGTAGPQSFSQTNERRDLVEELKRLNEILMPTARPEGAYGFAGGPGTGGLAGLAGFKGGGFVGGGGGFRGGGTSGGWDSGGTSGAPASSRRTTPGQRGGPGSGPGRQDQAQPEGTAKGAVSKADLGAMLDKHIEEAGLVGYVPPDGADYGITKGTKEEWRHFFTEIAGRESSYNPKTFNPSDKGTSVGLFQIGPAQQKDWKLGLGVGNTREELEDPNTNARVAVHLTAKLMRENGGIRQGAGLTFGPIARGWRPAAPGSRDVQPEGAGPRYQPGQTQPGVRDISGTTGLASDGTIVPEGLLVHHTGGREKSAEALADVLKSRTDPRTGGTAGGLSVQFAIERDGTIVALMPDGSKARHAGELERSTKIAGRALGNWNLEGVEIIARDEDDVTEAQKNALGQLYRMRQKRWGWKGPENSIYGHGELTGRKDKPSARGVIEGQTGTDIRTGKRQLPPEVDAVRQAGQQAAAGSTNADTALLESRYVNQGDNYRKDMLAANRYGMTHEQYSFGGLHPETRASMARAVRDFERETGQRAAFTAGFRDDYRQHIAEGYKASDTMSRHGGSDNPNVTHSREMAEKYGKTMSGYGGARALDIPSGAFREWMARHGSRYGYYGIPRDPPHVQQEESTPLSRQALEESQANDRAAKNAEDNAAKSNEANRGRSEIDRDNSGKPKGNVAVNVKVNAAQGTEVKTSSSGPLISKTTTERKMAPAEMEE